MNQDHNFNLNLILVFLYIILLYRVQGVQMKLFQ